jgi:hypothetical protein
MRKTTITKITVATRRRVIIRETGDPPTTEKSQSPVRPAFNQRGAIKLQPKNDEKSE